jgi:hypothetical protein
MQASTPNYFLKKNSWEIFATCDEKKGKNPVQTHTKDFCEKKCMKVTNF